MSSTKSPFKMTHDELKSELEDAITEVGKRDRDAQLAHQALIAAFMRERTVRDVMQARAQIEAEAK